LTQPVNNTSSNNEIYGVIPYIAPEIFKGAAFSKETDIYSMGMIMWELTTGCKPFANIEHDIKLIYKIIDGLRPNIASDTPECFANLMISCWDSSPSKRPSVKKICETIYFWTFGLFKEEDISNQFKQAEKSRLKSIELKKLGPEFNKNFHSDAIYTSRPLNSFISSINSLLKSNILSWYIKYISFG
jgi:serine/threonine protein kinase